MAIVRNPNTGKIVAKRFSLEQIEEADANYQGFCLACGAIKDGCEPDARKYECDECELFHVYGAAELAIMGRVDNC